MAVKLRLARVGKIKTPFYRIVAMDSRKSRDGAFLENLGTFDGLNTKLVQFHTERVDYWISKGAIQTDAFKKLHKLYREEGVLKS